VGIVLDGNGAPIVEPPVTPKGPRYAKLAEKDPDIADALRVLGNSEPLDWYDIYTKLGKSSRRRSAVGDK
jgi:hypothetical protein